MKSVQACSTEEHACTSDASVGVNPWDGIQAKGQLTVG